MVEAARLLAEEGLAAAPCTRPEGVVTDPHVALAQHAGGDRPHRRRRPARPGGGQSPEAVQDGRGARPRRAAARGATPGRCCANCSASTAPTVARAGSPTAPCRPAASPSTAPRDDRRRRRPSSGCVAHEAIRQLAARYAVAVDARDLDTLVGLFVADVRVGARRHPVGTRCRASFDVSLRAIGVSILTRGHPRHRPRRPRRRHRDRVLQGGDPGRRPLDPPGHRLRGPRTAGTTAPGTSSGGSTASSTGPKSGSTPSGCGPADWPAHHDGRGTLPEAWASWGRLLVGGLNARPRSAGRPSGQPAAPSASLSIRHHATWTASPHASLRAATCSIDRIESSSSRGRRPGRHRHRTRTGSGSPAPRRRAELLRVGGVPERAVLTELRRQVSIAGDAHRVLLGPDRPSGQADLLVIRHPRTTAPPLTVGSPSSSTGAGGACSDAVRAGCRSPADERGRGGTRTPAGGTGGGVADRSAVRRGRRRVPPACRRGRAAGRPPRRRRAPRRPGGRGRRSAPRPAPPPPAARR